MDRTEQETRNNGVADLRCPYSATQSTQALVSTNTSYLGLTYGDTVAGCCPIPQRSIAAPKDSLSLSLSPPVSFLDSCKPLPTTQNCRHGFGALSTVLHGRIIGRPSRIAIARPFSAIRLRLRLQDLLNETVRGGSPLKRPRFCFSREVFTANRLDKASASLFPLRLGTSNGAVMNDAPPSLPPSARLWSIFRYLIFLGFTFVFAPLNLTCMNERAQVDVDGSLIWPGVAPITPPTDRDALEGKAALDRSDPSFSAPPGYASLVPYSGPKWHPLSERIGFDFYLSTTILSCFIQLSRLALDRRPLDRSLQAGHQASTSVAVEAYLTFHEIQQTMRRLSKCRLEDETKSPTWGGLALKTLGVFYHVLAHPNLPRMRLDNLARVESPSNRLPGPWVAESARVGSRLNTPRTLDLYVHDLSASQKASAPPTDTVIGPRPETSNSLSDSGYLQDLDMRFFASILTLVTRA
ncbi:hypothetical protein SODALDRAFT_361694 [Sodiomyces alkalinus F11]|uniref:Uncharacterized protein n=1 Tax=Sodiomyces alkalinus (strain CBS 110278 / VKM F-3762 / F11) TaxID=1314773 RepID=A0A3N2PQW2_SODAK|nr:hypothetical protein SODALDRAFT_361694 [Sodiomyces alkalinus F11]ROT36868.1 hypothetical protein SODALDRAFT_361694 [Sodiomyces alkalinus F11]